MRYTGTLTAVRDTAAGRRSRPHQAPRQLLIVFVFLTSGQLRVSGAGFFSDFLPAWSLPS